MKSILMQTPSPDLSVGSAYRISVVHTSPRIALCLALACVFTNLAILPESDAYTDTSNFVNDQIAGHFEQMFGEGGESEKRQQATWLPGADEDGLLWGYESRLEVSGTWIAPARVRDTESKAEVSFVHATYGVLVPVGPRTDLGFVSTASRYHLGESTAPSHEKIFDYDHLWQWDVGFVTTLQLNPRWALFSGGIGIVSGGGGDAFETRLNGVAFLGAMMTVNPDLTIALGVSTSTSTALNSRSIPMFLVDWRIGNKTRLSVRNGVFFDYALSSDWRHVVGIGIEGSMWTVGVKHSDFGSSKKHYLVAEDVALNLKFTHRFNQGLSIETKVGMIRYGTHAILEGDRELSKREFESSLGVTLGLFYRF
jgi:hypothetical protein